MFAHISRRQAVGLAAKTALLLPTASLWAAACGNDESKTKSSAAAGNSNATSSTTGTSSTVDSSKWATGGTAAMSAQASYPSPFATAGTACTLTCGATAGPCYLQSGLPPTRLDVSEKQNGLPMRMQFRLLDASCAPISNASVEIWHTNAAGVYSGKTPNTNFCSNGNATAIAAQWFRGVAASDSSGVATFDSCFPGWYTSRTIHVHVRITVGGTERITTQFFFADDIADAIVAAQPVYKDRGTRDTTNQNDTVVSAAAAPSYCFDVQQMTDGAMLASKTVILRSNSSDSLCTIPSGSGGRTGKSAFAPEGPEPGADLHRG